MAYVPTLKTQYKEQIIAALMKEFGYTSVMQCPKDVYKRQRYSAWRLMTTLFTST